MRINGYVAVLDIASKLVVLWPTRSEVGDPIGSSMSCAIVPVEIRGSVEEIAVLVVVVDLFSVVAMVGLGLIGSVLEIVVVMVVVRVTVSLVLSLVLATALVRTIFVAPAVVVTLVVVWVLVVVARLQAQVRRLSLDVFSLQKFFGGQRSSSR